MYEKKFPATDLYWMQRMIQLVICTIAGENIIKNYALDENHKCEITFRKKGSVTCGNRILSANYIIIKSDNFQSTLSCAEQLVQAQESIKDVDVNVAWTIGVSDQLNAEINNSVIESLARIGASLNITFISESIKTFL